MREWKGGERDEGVEGWRDSGLGELHGEVGDGGMGWRRVCGQGNVWQVASQAVSEWTNTGASPSLLTPLSLPLSSHNRSLTA